MITKQNHLSIKFISARVILVITTLTLTFGLILTLGLIYQDYRLKVHAEEIKLKSTLKNLANSIDSEIMFGDETSQNAIIQSYSNQNSLQSAVLSNEETICPKNNFFQKKVCLNYSFEVKNKVYFLSATKLINLKPISDHFYQFVAIATFILILGFVAIKLINDTLFKSIISPIQSLLKSPETWSPKNASIAGEVVTMGELIKSYIQDRDKKQKEDQIIKIHTETMRLSRQVSHDIRSPLAALKVVKEMSASSLDADVAKLLTMSIDRITDIANTILPKGAKEVAGTSGTESSFIWMLADQIVSEKRVEYKNANNVSIQLEVEGSPFELNALCNPSEFMRSVSNIINNSIEARVSNKPIQIDLKLHSNQDMILLSIADNGKGISPEIFSKVFDESFSHGKSQGTGLGLFQVKQAVESWGGQVRIASQIGIGTTITLELKKSKKPQWLADSISIQQYDSMVVLDDEEYVFTILQDRFSEHFKNIRYFKRIEEFETFLPETTNALLFIDHDLKQDITGIELIQKHQLQNRSILLTGNYDDKQVQQRSTQNNIKILPKPLINNIPVVS